MREHGSILESLYMNRLNRLNEATEREITLGASKELGDFFDKYLKVGDTFTVVNEVQVTFVGSVEEVKKISKVKNVCKGLGDTVYATIPKGTKIEYVRFDRGTGGYYGKYFFKIKGTNLEFYEFYGSINSDTKLVLSSKVFSRMKIYSSSEEIVAAADKIVSRELKALGVKDLHLASYDELKFFENKLELAFREDRIDLSFKSANSSKYGIKVSGNAGGIASSYIYYLCNSDWKEVEWTNKKIREYLEKNPNIYVYKKGKYYSCEKIGRAEVLNTKFGSSSKTQGIGSQSSVNITKVKLLKDKAGNLCIDRFTEVWD